MTKIKIWRSSRIKSKGLEIFAIEKLGYLNIKKKFNNWFTKVRTLPHGGCSDRLQAVTLQLIRNQQRPAPFTHTNLDPTSKKQSRKKIKQNSTLNTAAITANASDPESLASDAEFSDETRDRPSTNQSDDSKSDSSLHQKLAPVPSIFDSNDTSDSLSFNDFVSNLSTSVINQ